MQRLTNQPRLAQGANRIGACLLAGASIGTPQARADDINWANINGGTFSVGTNWTGGVVPGANDFARFARSRAGNPQISYTVSFSTNPANQGIIVPGDIALFNLNGHAYSLTSPGTAIQIGTSTTFPGRLTATNGVIATAPDAQVLIGAGTNAPGLLNISTGAQLLGPRVTVGSGGPGTLIVQNGGDIVGGPMRVGSPDFGVTGTATITGAGSAVVVEDLIVGAVGAGTVNILSGGRVESTLGILGANDFEEESGLGTVNVEGANSRWTSSGTITVGSAGRGTLNITGGGLVQSPTGTVGDIPDSAGTVTIGGGSQWIMTDLFVVGFLGQATVTIAGGSLLQSALGIIGMDFTDGFVTVDGPGSRWINSSDLSVGKDGNGTMNIADGAEVRCDDGFISRFGGIGSARVSGAGSSWTIMGNLSVGGDVEQGANGGSGSLVIEAGGTVSADGLYLFPQGLVTLQGGTLDVKGISPTFALGGDFVFLGGVLHADHVGLPLLNQGGTLAPGHSAGTTVITGNYTQMSTGAMEIEIGGTAHGTQYDRVNVGGTALLNGGLDLRLINAFVPSPAQTFVILDAGTIAGGFAHVASGHRLAVSGGGGSFVVHYGSGSPFDPTQVVLSNFGPCPADFDNDGAIDFFDYDAFVICFEGGPCPPGKTADFDADGSIDFFDYDSFVIAFESGC
ncbi:MAG: hypothetical protein AABZ53_13180 [Planctomycetota bacterium]